jgi:hypothetical protein
LGFQDGETGKFISLLIYTFERINPWINPRVTILICMNNQIRLIAATLLFSFSLSGCYFDKENELYPTAANCDTAGVITYSHSIAPVMEANCNVCHNKSNASGDVITDNYDDLSIHALDGHLWSAVNWTGASHMPKGGEKLPECDLTKIKKWIDAGSLHN